MKRRDFVSIAGLAAVLPAASGAMSSEPAAAPNERAIEEPARTTPVAAEADVVVCGGGPAGTAAAIAAARSGAKTLLLEAHGCLGGIWTAGLLAYLLDTNNKKGILREILERIARVESQASGTPVRLATCCDPEIVKIVLERMCAEAKVRIQYHTRVCAAA
jgi:flavin-dependent dehydrogenase